MKLVSVQVQNYKCVEDSGEFSVNDLTCLAGKNESGKTALLEALRRLNPVEGRAESNYNPLFEYPRRQYIPQQEVDDPVLTTRWELSADDISAVEKNLGQDALAESTVSIQRGYNNQNTWTISIAETAVIKHMRSSENEAGTPSQSPNEIARDILNSRLPTFLYFPNYGTLPGRVSVDQFIAGNHDPEDAEEYRHFEALLELAGTSVNGLKQAAQSEELVAQLEAVSNRVSDKVFEYWSQNRHL